MLPKEKKKIYQDLLGKRTQLLDRLQKIELDKRRVGVGPLSADLSEQALELGNTEVLQVIERAARTELAAIDLRLSALNGL